MDMKMSPVIHQVLVIAGNGDTVDGQAFFQQSNQMSLGFNQLMQDLEWKLADAGIVVLADEKEMASLNRVDIKDQLEVLCLIKKVLF